MENLTAQYSNYGITAELLDRLIRKGIEEYGYSTEQATLLLRYTLGITFNRPEHFTLSELATMTGDSPKKLLDHLEGMLQGIEPNQI